MNQRRNSVGQDGHHLDGCIEVFVATGAVNLKSKLTIEGDDIRGDGGLWRSAIVNAVEGVMPNRLINTWPAADITNADYIKNSFDPDVELDSGLVSSVVSGKLVLGLCEISDLPDKCKRYLYVRSERNLISLLAVTRKDLLSSVDVLVSRPNAAGKMQNSVTDRLIHMGIQVLGVTVKVYCNFLEFENIYSQDKRLIYPPMQMDRYCGSFPDPKSNRLITPLQELPGKWVLIASRKQDGLRTLRNESNEVWMGTATIDQRKWAGWCNCVGGGHIESINGLTWEVIEHKAMPGHKKMLSTVIKVDSSPSYPDGLVYDASNIGMRFEVVDSKVSTRGTGREMLWRMSYLLDAASSIYVVLLTVIIATKNYRSSDGHVIVVLVGEIVAELMPRMLVALHTGVLSNKLWAPIHWSLSSKDENVKPIIRRSPIRMEALSGLLCAVIATVNVGKGKTVQNTFAGIAAIVGIFGMFTYALQKDLTQSINRSNMGIVFTAMFIAHAFAAAYQFTVFTEGPLGVATAVCAAAGFFEGVISSVCVAMVTFMGNNNDEEILETRLLSIPTILGTAYMLDSGGVDHTIKIQVLEKIEDNYVLRDKKLWDVLKEIRHPVNAKLCSAKQVALHMGKMSKSASNIKFSRKSGSYLMKGGESDYCSAQKANGKVVVLGYLTADKNSILIIASRRFDYSGRNTRKQKAIIWY